MGQPLSKTFGALLALEAARDALHFVCSRPIDSLDTDSIMDISIACYQTAGLQLEEAKVLYLESFSRLGERYTQAAKEMQGG